MGLLADQLSSGEISPEDIDWEKEGIIQMLRMASIGRQFVREVSKSQEELNDFDESTIHDGGFSSSGA